MISGESPTTICGRPPVESPAGWPIGRHADSRACQICVKLGSGRQICADKFKRALGAALRAERKYHVSELHVANL